MAKKKDRKLMLRIVIAGVLIVAATILMAVGLKSLYPPAQPKEPTRSAPPSAPMPEGAEGIDVSSHQGEIDWNLVAQSGIEFAMVRLGYRGYDSGTLHIDQYARKNLEGARAAGLRIGAYFFSQAVNAEEARQEAALALQVLDGMPLDLPLVYDWEYVSPQARTGDMDGETLLACVEGFCTSLGDYQPMIYFNKELSRTLLDLDELEQYPFWLAQYREELEFPYAVGMWQYTDQGIVDGIDGYVDRDRYYGIGE